MEVGYQHIHHPETEAGHYDDTCAYVEILQPVCLQIAYNCVQSLLEAVGVVPFIRSPLGHVRGLASLDARHARVVEALERTDRGGAHRYYLAPSGTKPAEEIQANRKRFAVHRVFGHPAPLDREESAGANVKANRFSINRFSPYCLKHSFSKVEPCCRGCYRAPDMGIYSLVPFSIQRLGVPVEVRRDGHLATEFEHLREGLSPIPEEAHEAGPVGFGHEFRPQFHCRQRSVFRTVETQNIAFPAL